jgi:hypothetical protein
MRKTIIMFMALAVVATMVIPVMSIPDHTLGDPLQGPDVKTTQTVITTGGGTVPTIKAKWETTSTDGWTEDDLVALGTQVNPVLSGDKYVYYWVVVTDVPVSDIDRVYVDVWHPDGTHKYQVPLLNILSDPDALAYWEAVHTHNPSIIYYGGSFTYDEIHTELFEQTAKIYWGAAKLSYCQPAGLYRVQGIVYDMSANTGVLENHFWYVPIVGVFYDFTVVDYDSAHQVYLNTWNQLDGDIDLGTILKPTVRTIGNVPVQFAVNQSDMGFGKTSGVTWNVRFKARLGGGSSLWTGEYLPYQNVTLPGHLPLCTTEKLDFQIFPVKLWLDAAGVPIYTYTGTITFWAFQYGSPETPYSSPDYNPYPLPNGWIP